MFLNCNHRKAHCPKCGKDTYESECESYFVDMKCPHCGIWFHYSTKKSKLVEGKQKDK